MDSIARPAWAPRQTPPIWAAAFFADPHATWAELQADGGIGYRAAGNVWLVDR